MAYQVAWRWVPVLHCTCSFDAQCSRDYARNITSMALLCNRSFHPRHWFIRGMRWPLLWAKWSSS
eukprot:6484084-Amphidinium_carterae.1